MIPTTNPTQTTQQLDEVDHASKEFIFAKGYLDKFAKWGDERGLTQIEAAVSQALKLGSELGELADNLAKGRDIKDDIGDCVVVLTILVKQTGRNLGDMIIVPEVIIDNLHEMFKDDHRNMYFGLMELYVQCVANQFQFDYVNNFFMFLCAMATAHGLEFNDCLAQAWNDIKDRTGVYRNGAFIKEADWTDEDRAFAESLKS